MAEPRELGEAANDTSSDASGNLDGEMDRSDAHAESASKATSLGRHPTTLALFSFSLTGLPFVGFGLQSPIDHDCGEDSLFYS
jgi:hypothetical protein